MHAHPDVSRRAALFGLVALFYTYASVAQPRVVIDATIDRGPVRTDVFGADLEFINMNVPEVAELASALPLLRFPGGDADSVFRWDQALRPMCTRAGTDWPTAAAIASRRGAGVFIETNIVHSSPSNAAAWVADAVRRGIRVGWVGIGNEVWGDWDAGFRTAARYANDVRAHATAIRTAAPGAKIVLEIGTFNEEPWNREAIRRAADVIDAVDYHYYPNHLEYGNTTPSSVMAGADGIAPLLARIRAMIREEAPTRAERIEVVFGEWDGAADAPPMSMMSSLVTPRSYDMWSMADGLFYGAALGEMLDGGVAAAMFYEVQGYRFGAIPGHWCLDANLAIRRPKVLVHQLWREHVGDRLIGSSASGMPTFHSDGPTNWDGFSGDAPVLRTYGSLADSGRSLRLMVVNRGDARAVSTVTFELRGFDPEPRASVWEVGGGAVTDTNENVGGAIDTVRVRSREITVASATFVFTPRPFSVAAIELRRRGATPPTDSGTDIGADSRTDIGADSRTDIGADSRTDIGADSRIDSRTDIGADSRIDSGADTGPDGARSDAVSAEIAIDTVLLSDTPGDMELGVVNVQSVGCGCKTSRGGPPGSFLWGVAYAAGWALRQRRGSLLRPVRPRPLRPWAQGRRTQGRWAFCPVRGLARAS